MRPDWAAIARSIARAGARDRTGTSWAAVADVQRRAARLGGRAPATTARPERGVTELVERVDRRR